MATYFGNPNAQQVAAAQQSIVWETKAAARNRKGLCAKCGERKATKVWGDALGRAVRIPALVLKLARAHATKGKA